MKPRVKICCIMSRDEARLAVSAGAHALGLVAATVYGRYHYAVDVLAGLALAIVTVPLASWLLARFDRRAES